MKLIEDGNAREMVNVLFHVPEGQALDAKFDLEFTGNYHGYWRGSISDSGGLSGSVGTARSWRTFGESLTADKLDKAYLTNNGMLQYSFRIIKDNSSIGNIYGFRPNNYENIVEIIAKTPLLETFDVGSLFLTLPMLRFVTLIDGNEKRNVFIRF